LIADDNAELLSALEIQLLCHGYEVVKCANADLAVAHAQKHLPDVMVVDIWMDAGNRLILSSTGNGFGVLERVMELPETKGIPIICMTGSNSAELDLRVRQLGARALLRKPINFAGLLLEIDAAAKQSPRGRAASGAQECCGTAATAGPQISNCARVA
jgi:CheY-like chemotaxis protein